MMSNIEFLFMCLLAHFSIELLVFVMLSCMSCMSSSSILDIKPVNIFSHSIGYLFILLIVSYTGQNLFSLV